MNDSICPARYWKRLMPVLAVHCVSVLCQFEPATADETWYPFQVSAKKVHVVKTTASRQEYAVFMDGSVDMENTTTRWNGNFEIAFQPNISLEIANTGDTAVVNPRVVVNDRLKWWKMEALLKEILAGAQSDQEKALLIWDFVRKHRHHDDPIFVDDELHDPVKMLNIYGGGLCDDSGYVGCSLLYHAGINKSKHGKNPIVRHLHGHMTCEAYIDGDYRFLDMDQDAFYLDRENEQLIGGKALARDHDLATREHASGPIFQGWQVGASMASFFGVDDTAHFRAIAGHRIDLTLRPGEKIIYRWDNVGKFPAYNSRRRRRFWGNSLHQYFPRLGIDTYATDATAAKGIVAPHPDAEGASLAGSNSEAFLEYEMKSPYPACGGRVSARFIGMDAGDRFAVLLSLDGEKWKPVWQHKGSGSVQCQTDLDRHLEVKQAPPKYRYLIRIVLASAAPKTAHLSKLTIETGRGSPCFPIRR